MKKYPEHLEELVRERTADLQRINEDLQKEVIARRGAEERSRYLASFPQLNPNPVIEVDSSGNVSFCNPATGKALESLGMDKEDVNVFLPADMGDILKSRDPKHETTHYREVSIGDNTFAESVYLSPEFDGARIYAYDITMRKKAEAALRESEERLKLAQQAANIGAFEWNVQTGVNVWTPQLEAMYGLARGEFVKTQLAWEQLVHPEDRAAAMGWVKEAFETGEPVEGEWRVVWRNGSVHWIAGRFQVFKDAAGRPLRLSGVNIDITGRKQAEEALRHSREDLDRAQEVGQMGWWRLDTRKNVLTWSDENYRLFGMPKGTPLTYETFLSAVHPDDREYVDTKWRAALRGQDYDIEHRIITGESVKWVREKAYLEFDENGALLGGFGITQDITERKRAENALRESEERFRLMAETSIDLIFQVDLSGRVTYCSPAVRQFGYLPEEVVGAHFPDYVAPAYVPVALEAFRQSLAGRHLNVFELSVLKKDGSPAIVEVSVAPIVQRGRTAGVQGIARDISERKRVDSELRRARAELEIRVRERTAELLEKTRMLETSMREIEDLYNNAPCGYHSIDADGVIVRINNTELKWLGYSRKEVVGKTRFTDLMTPESLQVYEESFPIFKRRGWVNDIDCTVIRRDGTPLPVALNSTAIVDDNGNFVMSRSTLFDITERREAQQKETAISELLKLFSKTFNRQGYLDSLVVLLRQWCGCECAGVRLAEKNGDFPYASSTGFSSEFLKQEGCLALGKDSCACTRVFQERADNVDTSFITADGSFVCNDSSYLKHAKKSGGTAAYRSACAEHGFASLAVVPIRYRDTVKGVIHLADKGSEKFAGKIVALVEAMTPLIGEALQRFDVESALNASREQLRSLSSHLLAAREEERLRVAREIHDDLGQTLTAAAMELGLLKKEVKKTASAVAKIESITGLIDEAVEDVQRICSELRPRILDHLGLRAAIEWQAKKFADRTGISCLLDLPHERITLAPDSETALFRIFQEALTNVARHAEATRASVRLVLEDKGLTLEITDDGKGIAKNRISCEDAFGIMGMKERAHELGGDITVKGARNKGTTVTVKVPMEKGETHV